MANSNFYANIGVNAGFTRSRSNTSSHTEGAAVTTLKPMNENSSITYSNVNNITYQGTQAQGGTFIYNNVANIQKEAVELHNSYTSSSSSRGINAGATIGYGHKIQTTGNGGSISASQSNQNTVETVYANGNFKNVNEVHNNTGSMVLNGFNQEGGKVTGNIGKVEVISRQNTSTTTGSSSGISLGISANGVPSSVNISESRTNGDRAFVDNQSTFIVGEGSSLHVGRLENTGAVVGKEGNSTFKIDSYVGKDIQNHDTMKTTGGSVGISTGKPRITNVGFNQDSRDKQGITRNTVVGDVEIGETSGSPINRDITRANETTKDTHSSTNINVESQTIEYATNPAKLKEDIGKAKEEINDIKWAIKESIHDRGDDNRNFFGQLSEVRLDKSLENITSERLIGKTVDTEIAGIFKDAYKDLGYDINIIFSDPKNSPQLLDEKGKPKTGTAYVDDYGVKTIIINAQDSKNTTKAGLIGTIVEEGSHVIGKVEGRQRKTGTDEKGLESTGRASNEYFAEKYKDDNTPISIHSDGKDYSNVDFGENVGDTGGACLGGKLLQDCLARNKKFMDDYKKVDRKKILPITSFFLDLTPAGTIKGGIEGIIGKDILTGEDLNLLTRVLSIIPIARPAFKGTKKLIKIFKIAGKKQVVLADGTKIMLNLDEVTKFEKEAKNIAKTSNVLKDLKSETIMKRFNATIDSGNKGKGFKVNGDYRMALKEFYSLNPKNVRSVPKPKGEEMFIGTIDVGGKEVTISVRNYSSKLSENNPTIDLLEKGKKNPKKIRYVK